jgi:hypothetical protein
MQDLCDKKVLVLSLWNRLAVGWDLEQELWQIDRGIDRQIDNKETNNMDKSGDIH